MRWFITKRHLVALIGVLVAIMLLMAFTSCIPVTVRPQFDDKGLPIALPVTPTGSISADGTLTPIYDVSSEAPKETNWGAIGTVLGAIMTALLATYGINLRGAVAKAKTAIGLVANLADSQAKAETDEDVARNKALAAQMQEAAGVRDLIQKARGK